MDAITTQEAATEVCKVLDTLTALSVDLACHRNGHPERLVLSAGQVRHSCDTISQAVSALKHILQITEAHGGGLIPAAALTRLQQASD